MRLIRFVRTRLTRPTPRALALAASPALFCCTAAPALADGVVFLSGDSNIANPLQATSEWTVDPGNQRFFSNVLGGGTTVVIDGARTQAAPEANGPGRSSINAFYGGLPGVSSSIIPAGAEITPATLAGVDLFVSILPADDYTASELSALSAFLAAGGDAFFIGEHASLPVFLPINARIASAIASLGGNMSIVPGSFFGWADPFTGVRDVATGNRIAADPYTAGVTTLTLGVAGEVTGGTPLFRGPESQPFVAYQTVVPEPAAATLLIALAAAFAPLRRRRQ